MGCTFIAPGPLPPEQVLDGIRDGLFVRRMEVGTTDPHTGRAGFFVQVFSFTVGSNIPVENNNVHVGI